MSEILERIGTVQIARPQVLTYYEAQLEPSVGNYYLRSFLPNFILNTEDDHLKVAVWRLKRNAIESKILAEIRGRPISFDHFVYIFKEQAIGLWDGTPSEAKGILARFGGAQDAVSLILSKDKDGKDCWILAQSMECRRWILTHYPCHSSQQSWTGFRFICAEA